MHKFDERLCALAGCPVIKEKGGAMIFNPHPIIMAENDGLLAHEICHILAGRSDYDIFITAVEARNNDSLFKHILNMLCDWYHEYSYGKYSGFLWDNLSDLHKNFSYNPIGLEAIDSIDQAYCNRQTPPEKYGIRDMIDIVAFADRVCESTIKTAKKLGLDIPSLINLLPGGLRGPKSDIGMIPKRSDYYIRTVARYSPMIRELSKLWKRNKYEWVHHYYGEINWKNLPGMLLGSKINLPVWKLFSKISVSRKVFMVIDRSGSTNNISSLIMDTAIIIAESLRMLNIPISVLDVGVTNSIVNDIDDELDLSWFTPMSDDGTPLGEVCSLITKANPKSYLLIITDGQPNNWEALTSILYKFPGSYLTFVIGDSYGDYAKRIKNAVHVEPHTIIREMIYESALN